MCRTLRNRPTINDSQQILKKSKNIPNKDRNHSGAKSQIICVLDTHQKNPILSLIHSNQTTTMKLITKQLIYGKEVTIIADADEVPKHDTYFQLTSVSKGRAFKVQESTITNEGISVKLHEACYHSDTLAQKTNAVNPKDLIGAELELITDQDRIKRIKEQATWC